MPVYQSSGKGDPPPIRTEFEDTAAFHGQRLPTGETYAALYTPEQIEELGRRRGLMSERQATLAIGKGYGFLRAMIQAGRIRAERFGSRTWVATEDVADVARSFRRLDEHDYTAQERSMIRAAEQQAREQSAGESLVAMQAPTPRQIRALFPGEVRRMQSQAEAIRKAEAEKGGR